MADLERTYRWRRRAVMPVRVTWMAMVVVLFLMTHNALSQHLHLQMGMKVLAFILVVVLPTIALILWRLGLLPPERVEVTPDE